MWGSLKFWKHFLPWFVFVFAVSFSFFFFLGGVNKLQKNGLYLLSHDYFWGSGHLSCTLLSVREAPFSLSICDRFGSYGRYNIQYWVMGRNDVSSTIMFRGVGEISFKIGSYCSLRPLRSQKIQLVKGEDDLDLWRTHLDDFDSLKPFHVRGRQRSHEKFSNILLLGGP